MKEPASVDSHFRLCRTGKSRCTRMCILLLPPEETPRRDSIHHVRRNPIHHASRTWFVATPGAMKATANDGGR
jgi:hypothetical protein